MTAYYNEFDPYAAQWIRNLIAASLIPTGDVDERSIVDVSPADLAGYVQCHWFAGVAGWALAARLAGFPDDRELWTGSAPCQPFSVAGQGKAQADDRHLWPHLFRLVSARRPDVLMGEQVAAAVGKGWLDGVFADLEGIGYACGATVVPACAVDAPHRRDRLWFMADAGGTRLAQRECDARVLPSMGGKSEGQDSADDAGAVGNTDESCASEERQQRSGQLSGAGGDTGACVGDVADADCGGWRARSNNQAAGYRQAASSEGRRSAWDSCAWITGHDGKARRVEPSIRLLAHGVPARVGRLRAYGNSIVVPLAAEVIGAYMDCRP
jgi:DNA (cytosine-5)-methyltransferase 1